MPKKPDPERLGWAPGPLHMIGAFLIAALVLILFWLPLLVGVIDFWTSP